MEGYTMVGSIITSLIFSLGTAPSIPLSIENGATAQGKAIARTELAVAYYSEKQYGNALSELKLAIEHDSSYGPAQNMLGIVNMELKRNDEAERAFRAALSIDKENPDNNNNYGWFLCQTNRINDAYAYFEKAASNPSYTSPARAYFNAGKCALLENDEPKAMHFFVESLKLSPNATAVLLEIAKMHYKQGRYDEVIQTVEQISDIEGPVAQALWLALQSERKKGNMTEVESYGLQIQKKFPKSPEAAMWKAKAFQ